VLRLSRTPACVAVLRLAEEDDSHSFDSLSHSRSSGRKISWKRQLLTGFKLKVELRLSLALVMDCPSSGPHFDETGHLTPHARTVGLIQLFSYCWHTIMMNQDLLLCTFTSVTCHRAGDPCALSIKR